MARRTNPPEFPNLEACIMMKLISKGEIANRLGISRAAFQHKLNGKTEFTLREAEQIAELFPDMHMEELFARMPRKEVDE